MASEADKRMAADQEFVSAILQDVPAEHQAMARETLLRYLGELRNNPPKIEPRSDAEKRAARRTWEAEVRRTRGLVPVTVALVPDLGAPDIRAVVLRQLGDEGQPILLLREADASDTDLRRGLRAAAESIRRLGATPGRKVKAVVRGEVRGSEAGPPASAQGKSGLELLRRVDPREIPGFGQIRAMTVLMKVEGPGPAAR